MNYTPETGWYYLDGNRKAPAWTGVEFLWRFLTRPAASVGPAAAECALRDLQPGDLVQLSAAGGIYTHTPVVVLADRPRSLGQVLVAAHSEDSDNRPLSTYSFVRIRFLHVTGVWRPEDII